MDWSGLGSWDVQSGFDSSFGVQSAAWAFGLGGVFINGCTRRRVWAVYTTRVFKCRLLISSTIVVSAKRPTSRMLRTAALKLLPNEIH